MTAPPDRRALLGTPQSFGKDRRLRSRTDFERVQATGRKETTRHFVFVVAPAKEDAALRRATPCKLGLVVSRRVGDAVRRNRVKRLCRECFRTWIDFLPQGTNLVVIARPGAAALSLLAVQREWEKVQPRLLALTKKLEDPENA